MGDGGTPERKTTVECEKGNKQLLENKELRCIETKT